MHRYRVVATAPGAVLGRIAGLAARSMNVPMALVSIVGGDEVSLIAAHGFGEQLPPILHRDPLLASTSLNGAVEVVDDARSDPKAAASEFVQDHRIRFYAAAPIVTFDGHRLGAVTAMDTDVRQVSANHLTILEDLAAIVMEQLELRLSALDAVGVERRLRGAAETARDDAQRDRDSAEESRGAAERDRDEARRQRDQARADRGIAERDRDSIEEYATALQRTLLPPSLPRIEGLIAAAYFRPISSRRVGGDFYDLFSLGGNRWAFFIGDVLGHGVDAAVVTSLIRYTLRSAALHYDNPTSGLYELNAVLLREVEPRRFCTVHFGTLQPAEDGDGFTVTIATGGHPPALLADPASRHVQSIRPGEGMLVGALTDAVFDVCSVTVRPGQFLVFFTDGLVEARLGGRSFDESALSEFVSERAGAGLKSLMDEIATLAPKLDQRDDIAVLAFEVAADIPA
ncbi:PP2C family protein-serine/threonine phosphatase [Mycolicibacterium iranicum]|nr:GAF domain-containing SpoIIE family protein phosphatase [Mycolicibacterium iranicum]